MEKKLYLSSIANDHGTLLPYLQNNKYFRMQNCWHTNFMVWQKKVDEIRIMLSSFCIRSLGSRQYMKSNYYWKRTSTNNIIAHSFLSNCDCHAAIGYSIILRILFALEAFTHIAVHCCHFRYLFIIISIWMDHHAIYHIFTHTEWEL